MNGRKQTAANNTTWRAIDQGDPKICPRTFPSCLSANVATAHVDRVTNHPTKEEGQCQEAEGQIEQARSQEELGRWQWRHHKEPEESDRPHPLPLDQRSGVFQIVLQPAGHMTLEMACTPGQEVPAAHGGHGTEHHKGDWVEVPVEPGENKHGPCRWTECRQEIDPEDDGKQSQVLHVATLWRVVVGWWILLQCSESIASCKRQWRGLASRQPQQQSGSGAQDSRVKAPSEGPHPRARTPDEPVTFGPVAGKPIGATISLMEV